MGGRRSQPILPSVLGIFGPTASGKTAVAEAIAERIPAELVSADSMQVYRGLPILTNQAAGARLVGIWPLDRQGTVGEYQELAHAAIDEIAAAGKTPVVVGGSGLWFQAALTDVRLPADAPSGARAALGAALRPARRGDGARGPRAARPARPRRRCTRTTASASSARSSSWEAGATLVPEQTAPLDGRPPSADARGRSRRRARDAGCEDRGAHPLDVRARGCRGGTRGAGDVGAAGAGPRGRAHASAGGGDRRGRARHASASPPTSASGCAGSRASS